MSAISNHAFLRLGSFRIRRSSHLPEFWMVLQFLAPVFDTRLEFWAVFPSHRLEKCLRTRTTNALTWGFLCLQQLHSQSWLQNRPEDSRHPTAARIAASPQPASVPTATHVDARHSSHDSHETRFRIHQQPKAKPSRPCNPQPGNPPANLRCASARPTLSRQGSRPLLARPRQGFRKTTASNC